MWTAVHAVAVTVGSLLLLAGCGGSSWFLDHDDRRSSFTGSTASVHRIVHVEDPSRRTAPGPHDRNFGSLSKAPTGRCPRPVGYPSLSCSGIDTRTSHLVTKGGGDAARARLGLTISRPARYRLMAGNWRPPDTQCGVAGNSSRGRPQDG